MTATNPSATKERLLHFASRDIPSPRSAKYDITAVDGAAGAHPPFAGSQEIHIGTGNLIGQVNLAVKLHKAQILTIERTPPIEGTVSNATDAFWTTQHDAWRQR